MVLDIFPFPVFELEDMGGKGCRRLIVYISVGNC